MSNPKLSEAQRAKADRLLNILRKRLLILAGADRELLFAYRRRLLVKLTHDERGTPAQRNKLKLLKLRAQDGKCGRCGAELPLKYSELDRTKASDGYTIQNTRLVHHNCHIADQIEKMYR
jgi:hypothetical protein